MNVYGKLSILNDKRLNNKVLCRCDCGTEKWINIYQIIKGDIKSCGCLKKQIMKLEASKRFTGKSPVNFKDYTGKRIGLVTVIKRIKEQEEETWYLLKCDCGYEFETRISNLRRCKYKKCICKYPKHKLKNLLQKMNERCVNPKNSSFKWYGEKGITVYEEWKKFPRFFIEWSLENGWKQGLTIDRKDASKGYNPENCQWITRSENARKSAEERWERKNTE